MALELVTVDDDIRQRQERKVAEKEGKTADAKAKRATVLSFSTLGRRRTKAAKHSKEHRTANSDTSSSPALVSDGSPSTGSVSNVDHSKAPPSEHLRPLQPSGG